jgi:hypothetical protein
MTKKATTEKVDHYKATEGMNEERCKAYCEKLADRDIKLFKTLTFDRDKLISGYYKMYYSPTKKQKPKEEVVV